MWIVWRLGCFLIAAPADGTHISAACYPLALSGWPMTGNTVFLKGHLAGLEASATCGTG